MRLNRTKKRKKKSQINKKHFDRVPNWCVSKCKCRRFCDIVLRIEKGYHLLVIQPARSFEWSYTCVRTDMISKMMIAQYSCGDIEFLKCLLVSGKPYHFVVVTIWVIVTIPYISWKLSFFFFGGNLAHWQCIAFIYHRNRND